MSLGQINKFTGQIRAKGWLVKDFIAHIGRSQDWYFRQVRADEKTKMRLKLMIKGLDEKC